MKKYAFVLMLFLTLPLTANAVCSLDNTDGDKPDSTTCTTSELSNLRRDVDLQASAGVNIHAEDATNDINVATCHSDGSSGFFGNTAGGSVEENTSFDPSGGTCSSATYSDIESSS